jgi:hypothetical protein
MGFNLAFKGLTLILLTCRIWLAANNARRWQMGFNLAFKGLIKAWICGRSLAGVAGSNTAQTWLYLSCNSCVLSGRGLCDGPIFRTEESYRLWRINDCNQMQQ